MLGIRKSSGEVHSGVRLMRRWENHGFSGAAANDLDSPVRNDSVMGVRATPIHYAVCIIIHETEV